MYAAVNFTVFSRVYMLLFCITVYTSLLEALYILTDQITLCRLSLWKLITEE